MVDVPVTGALAEYHEKRYPILFGGDDWVALPSEAGADMPDAFEHGEFRLEPGRYQPWAKVPMSALDGVIDVVATGTLSGHSVSLLRQKADGRVVVEFVGPPAVAREIGLEGDQYMGWTGLIDPEALKDIRVEETRRA